MNRTDRNQYDHLPISSYEEAISSRPTSDHRLEPEEISNDAERQRLLRYMNRNESPRNGYEPPTIKPARSSLDLDLDEAELRRSTDGLRQELEQMEFEEPSPSANSSRSILNNRFSKHISSFTSLLLFHLLLLVMTRGNQLWPSTCAHNQLRLLLLWVFKMAKIRDLLGMIRASRDGAHH
jgi:hypothetical protein